MLLGHGTQTKFRERLCEKKCFTLFLKEAREVAVIILN